MAKLNLPDKSFDALVGQSVAAFIRLENSEIRLLAVLLKCGQDEAQILFQGLQSVHSRLDIYKALSTLLYKDDIKAFLNGIFRQIENLAATRNAIVHWHPLIRISVNFSDTGDGEAKAETAKRPVSPYKKKATIGAKEIEQFILDCAHVVGNIDELARDLKPLKGSLPASLLDKYCKPHSRDPRVQSRRGQTPRRSKPAKSP